MHSGPRPGSRTSSENDTALIRGINTIPVAAWKTKAENYLFCPFATLADTQNTWVYQPIIFIENARTAEICVGLFAKVAVIVL